MGVEQLKQLDIQREARLLVNRIMNHHRYNYPYSSEHQERIRSELQEILDSYAHITHIYVNRNGDWRLDDGIEADIRWNWNALKRQTIVMKPNERMVYT